MGKTRRDQLIKEGLLEVVPLTPAGRSKGITMRSIRRYQAMVMHLAETEGTANG